MKPTELNPDYVRFQNDKKKKRLTKRHLAQQIAWEKRTLEQCQQGVRRDLVRLAKQKVKIAEMEREYEAME